MGTCSIKVFKKSKILGWFFPTTVLTFDLRSIGWNQCIPLTRIMVSSLLVDGMMARIAEARSVDEISHKYRDNFPQLIDTIMTGSIESSFSP
jgi:hypothetical protein